MKGKSIKLVGVGFQKTGTSTLREALKILGYKVGDTRYRLLLPILRNNWKQVFKELDRYDAVEDNPWPFIYREIDEHYKGSKFILTIRDSESWYKSVNNHIGDLRDPMHEWIYGRKKGLPKDDKTNAIMVYKKHNEAVLSYFYNRPDDFLILDFSSGDGWSKLCNFLGKEIPGLDFPHINKASYGVVKKESPGRKLKMLKKRIKYALQIRYIDLLGLWKSSENEKK